MNNVIKRVWNQNRMGNIEDLNGMTFQDESEGHTFQISGVDDAGNTVALTGSVAGVFLRPDNTDVAISGSVSGGVVSVTLPPECYDVPGRFGLTVFVTNNGQKTAVYAAMGTVSRTSSGAVSPGTTSDAVDLINRINAAVATIPASWTGLMADIAPTYSASAVYPVGAYCYYNGDLYRCTTAITTAESWTAGHWTPAVLGQDVSDLKSALDDTVKAFDFDTGVKMIVFIRGKTITIPSVGSVVDINNMTNNANGKCAVYPCEEGDYFTINIIGGDGARGWCFTDENYEVISVSGSGIIAPNDHITAPTGAKYLILNNVNNSSLDKPSYLGTIIDDRVKQNANNISGIKSDLNSLNGSDVAIVGKQVATPNDVFDPDDTKVNASARYAIYRCKAGDTFTITGTGGSGARLYCFVNSSFDVLAIADSGEIAFRKIITAPANSAYVVFNDLSGRGFISRNDFPVGSNPQIVNRMVNNEKIRLDKVMPDRVFIDNVCQPFVKYENSSGYITNGEYNTGFWSVIVPLDKEYEHDMVFQLSEHFSDYVTARAFYVKNDGTVYSSGNANLNNKKHTINAYGLRQLYTVREVTKIYVCFINFANSSRNSFATLSPDAFCDIYYFKNELAMPTDNEPIDGVRAVKVSQISNIKDYDLFVFAGQSNMMGASAIPPTDMAECYPAYEYLYNPRYKSNGANSGQFVLSKHPAGEFSYTNRDAWASGNVDENGKSTRTDYATYTYFCPAMANKSGDGTVVAFQTYSESNFQAGQSMAPLIAREYASYGRPCVYAHIAKGGQTIQYFLGTEGGLSSGAHTFFKNKVDAMIADFATLMPDCTIRNKCFVWCQGEGQGSLGVDGYKAQLEDLWDWAKNEMGFTKFFCVRVGYWGQDSVKYIMKAQEEFCAENDNCYIVTRAMSYMLYPQMNIGAFYNVFPGEEYQDCRDSYLGYENNHINEKGDKLVAKRAAYNINRILNEGLDPVLEPENVNGI